MLTVMVGPVQYELPTDWIAYDRRAIDQALLEARARMLALQAIPFQRRWVTELSKIQLKSEIAGTSRIEGADFVGDELDEAMEAESPAQLSTRSQKQGSAALRAYRWIAKLPGDFPVMIELIQQVHRLIVTGCDDDHCEPGALRRADHNVTFGTPRHRGANGGRQCRDALESLVRATATTFKSHELLIQALALHYHLAAMHPFEDGNGRTARVIEALMLQRAGLKDALFVPMSNYYYDHKDDYLSAIAAVRARRHDLTPFLEFALNGIAQQVDRLTGQLQREVKKGLYRNLMNDLFTRLEGPRKRVIVERQLILLNYLLKHGEKAELEQLSSALLGRYASLKKPRSAIARDINRLAEFGAVAVTVERSGAERRFIIKLDLDWPSKITDTEFFERLDALPKSSTYGALTPTSLESAPGES